MASEGYPSIDGTAMTLGEAITLPDGILNADNTEKPLLFIAGARCKDGTWVNSGGRVLGVTAMADDVEKARSGAYDALTKINFKGAHWRKDIGS